MTGQQNVAEIDALTKNQPLLKTKIINFYEWIFAVF